MTRSLGIVVAVAAAALTLTACGSGSISTVSVPVASIASPSAKATTKPTPTPETVEPERTVEETTPEPDPTTDSAEDQAVPWRDLGDFSYSVPGTYDCDADAGYGCGVMIVRANVDCPAGIYIKVAHYSGMTIVGFQNSSTGAIATGETARLDFPWTEAGDTSGGFGQDWDLTDDWGCG